MPNEPLKVTSPTPALVAVLEVAGSGSQDICLRLNGEKEMAKIELLPEEGRMICKAAAPGLGGRSFSLGIPETIGSSESMILNFPEVNIRWQGPDRSGAVRHRWVSEQRIDYSLALLPGEDTVDVEMTIRNISAGPWRKVFAFDCVNPSGAPEVRDLKRTRTYMSKARKPFSLDGATRVNEGPLEWMSSLQFYLTEGYQEVSPFVAGFRSTSPDRTDGSYIVTLSEDGRWYMAATSPKALFLFDNLDGCCIHSAPDFGDIRPGEDATVTSRLYFARGTLDDFLRRYRADFPEGGEGRGAGAGTCG